MTKYELDKIAHKALPNMTIEEINKFSNVIEKFINEHLSKYYMLLNNDNKYYTLYTFVQEPYNIKQMVNEIIEVIAQDLGKIKMINTSQDGNAIEIWTIFANDECEVFYLFDYQRGVIEIV